MLNWGRTGAQRFQETADPVRAERRRAASCQGVGTSDGRLIAAVEDKTASHYIRAATQKGK